jgi:hypothetical protein
MLVLIFSLSQYSCKSIQALSKSLFSRRQQCKMQLAIAISWEATVLRSSSICVALRCYVEFNLTWSDDVFGFFSKIFTIEKVFFQ